MAYGMSARWRHEVCPEGPCGGMKIHEERRPTVRYTEDRYRSEGTPPP
jgi:hypothetical protein